MSQIHHEAELAALRRFYMARPEFDLAQNRARLLLALSFLPRRASAAMHALWILGQREKSFSKFAGKLAKLHATKPDGSASIRPVP